MQSNVGQRVPKRNIFVDDKYLRLLYKYGQPLYSFKIGAHLMNDRFFTKTEFYDHFRTEPNVCEWYFKMNRILYMGKMTGPRSVVDREMEYFSDPNLFCQHLGAHVFINNGGTLTSILCYIYTHQTFQAMGYASINAIMPKYRQFSEDQDLQVVGSGPINYSLQIATRMQIVNIADGDRDGRHGETLTGGVFHLTDRAIADDLFQTYLRNQDMVLPFFGIYVCENAKLVVIDPCRIEECAEPTAVHHTRTLYLSGAFLIIEGLYCFRFASKGSYIYTELDLEDDGIIELFTITGKMNPIFFLQAVNTCETIAWCLGPIEDLRHSEQWVLTIPDGGHFEAIEEYDTGVNQVMHLQSRTPSPWSDNVEKPGNNVSHISMFQIPEEDQQRLNHRLNLLQTNQNQTRINWARLAICIPPPINVPQFTVITPLFEPITNDNRVVVKLLLGTPMSIPYEYRFTTLEWFSRMLSQPLFYGMLVNRYYVINKFWYRRVSPDNHHPLIVQYVAHTDLPDHLCNVWSINVMECQFFRLFMYLIPPDNPANAPQNENIEFVVLLYWESPLTYLI